MTQLCSLGRFKSPPPQTGPPLQDLCTPQPGARWAQPCCCRNRPALTRSCSVPKASRVGINDSHTQASHGYLLTTYYASNPSVTSSTRKFQAPPPQSCSAFKSPRAEPFILAKDPAASTHLPLSELMRRALPAILQLSTPWVQRGEARLPARQESQRPDWRCRNREVRADPRQHRAWGSLGCLWRWLHRSSRTVKSQDVLTGLLHFPENVLLQGGDRCRSRPSHRRPQLCGHKSELFWNFPGRPQVERDMPCPISLLPPPLEAAGLGYLSIPGLFRKCAIASYSPASPRL